jgi:hypothetical protein
MKNWIPNWNRENLWKNAFPYDGGYFERIKTIKAKCGMIVI